MKESLIIILPAACIFYALVSYAFDAFEDLSGGRVRHLEESDPELASRLDRWLEEEDALRTFFKMLLFIAAMVIGICVILLSERFPGFRREWFVPVLSVSAVLIVCCLSELLSKIVLRNFDLTILKIAMPLISCAGHVILAPFFPLYRFLDRRAGHWFGAGNNAVQATVEDEILDLMEDEPDGQLEEGEKRMIKGIFELPNMSVREIMTPRVDMIALPVTASMDEAKALIVSSGHSRIPVYGRSIDEIKGIIYAKDFVNPENTRKNLSQLLHNPIFIPETKAVDELLDEIQRCHNHFAVIIDEYGGTSGIVTFEDIIEEIVGDVRDEFDPAEDAAQKPQLMPDGTVVLESRTPLSEVNEILDIEIPETDAADTIGGYICSSLGRIPETGEVFKAPGLFSAVIQSADLRKINKIKMKVEDEDAGDE